MHYPDPQSSIAVGREPVGLEVIAYHRKKIVVHAAAEVAVEGLKRTGRELIA